MAGGNGRLAAPPWACEADKGRPSLARPAGVLRLGGQVAIRPPVGMVNHGMERSSGTAPAVPSSDLGGAERARTPWPALAIACACIAAGAGLAGTGSVLPGLGVGLAGVAAAILWVVPGQAGTGRSRLGAEMVARASQGDPDLYLDLDAVEVHAVYQLGTEIYAHLRGGVGQRADPVTGSRRPIETSDVSLTWRCSGRRSADRLASQLNEWESKGTPLRLLAMRGRSALLIEDDNVWVSLPELRLAA